MALFENYEGRMPQLQPVLEKYGFANFDEVKAYTNSMGVDAYNIVESTQPICFENVKWAYELGAAIAMKKNAETAAKAAETGIINIAMPQSLRAAAATTGPAAGCAGRAGVADAVNAVVIKVFDDLVAAFFGSTELDVEVAPAIACHVGTESRR